MSAASTDWHTKLAVLKRGGRLPAWWALTNHRTHKGQRLNFRDNPCLKAFYLDDSPEKAIKKATQVGVSEYLVCFSLAWAIDGLSIFYVLPTYQLVGRFVHNRFDRTVERTPAYARYAAGASDRSGFAENVTLKHFGLGAIAFVGSNSTTGFTEFPADVAIVDELDECDPDNIKMAWERLSASEKRWQIWVGNPTVKNVGIDEKFEASDGKEWHLRCEGCGRLVMPNFFRHVVREESPSTYRVLDREWDPASGRDARMVCDCGAYLNRKGDGVWVAARPGIKRSGYHLTKLVAGTVTIAELLGRLEAGTKSETALARFYNGDLGLAYVGKGAKIDRDMLDACRREYALGQYAGTGIRIAGIDVGGAINVVVGEVQPDGLVRVVRIMAIGKTGTMRDAGEVLRVLRDNRVMVGVIDALPEKRMSAMIAARHPGMFACFYVEGKHDLLSGKTVGVDRTAALDQVKDMVLNQFVLLPREAASVPNFYDQMTASTRFFDSKAKQGLGAWKWVSGEQPDHYYHAMAYMMIARNLSVHVVRRSPAAVRQPRATTEEIKEG